ncbi:MAG TPA: hypothetical protein VFB60_02400 [Ktedonobacteraceae bacterium]|nr:hypothetical protein [Ktedonobacteraceae bacterium]
MMMLDDIGDDTVQNIHSKEEQYERYVRSTDYLSGSLLADAWCAAFVWKKTKEFAYPITHEVLCNIEQNPYSIPGWMREEIIRLRQQYKFFHWHLAFPGIFRTPINGEAPENKQTGWCGGFDVILSNPPWDRIKIQEEEWFATVRPDIANAPNAAQRRKMIAELIGDNPEKRDPLLYAAFKDDQRQASGESHLVRNSRRYPLCGRGDINIYAIFAELMHTCIKPTGRVGCIVQSGIATDDTTKFFFQDVTETQTLVSLYSFENEEFLFPAVHHATKFCLLTLSGRAKCQKAADFVFFARKTSDLEDESRHFSLSVSDVALLNPNTHTCPIFRSKHDMLLTKKIYERVPVLIKEGSPEINPWYIKFSRMFDMANDSHLFLTHEQLKSEGWELEGNVFCKDGKVCLPLYEGKMISHFDHRFGTYEGQTQAQANQGKLPELTEEQHVNSSTLPLPQYWVHEAHFKDFLRQGRKALLVFRDTARSTDIRTAIFCVTPIVACGHKLPIILLNPEYNREITYFAGCVSSFVFDYVTRQKVGGASLGLFILKQLPVLPLELYTSKCQWDDKNLIGDWIFLRALELTYTAWDLEPFAKDCGYDGPPFCWNEERRFLLRCELDAAYFHLYGVARDDVDYIMETFRVWKEKEEKQCGEYRTKRVILEIYDEMQQAIETGEPYQTRLDPPPADPAVAHPPGAEVRP